MFRKTKKLNSVFTFMHVSFFQKNQNHLADNSGPRHYPNAQLCSGTKRKYLHAQTFLDTAYRRHA